MSGQIQYGSAEAATSLETPRRERPEDHVHFTTPVRFGRRRTDQVGQLVLTSNWLRFRGTVELSIAWSEIARVEQAGPDIIVSLQGSSRTLRFSCQASDEADRGAIIASHLAGLAQSEPYQALYTP